MSPASLRPYGRRDLFGLAAGGTLAALAAAVLPASDRAAAATARRTHFRAVVIGSGFGGAVAALRLGRAGVDTLVLERGGEVPVGEGTEHHYEAGLDIVTGATVGGGSISYFGASVAPEQPHFERLYPRGLRYDELTRIWFPRARRMLKVSDMPADVIGADPYTHARAWSAGVRRAGFTAGPVGSVFDWRAVREELAGRTRAVAIAGDTTGAAATGAKRTLRHTYLPAALATGNVQLRARHEVAAIERARGGYTLHVRRLAPDGALLASEEVTCELLFLAAGTVGTNRLLVAARDTGALADLPAAVGSGFGDNGDQITACALPSEDAGTRQGMPIAAMARVREAYELPLTLECGHLPPTIGAPLCLTIAMTVDTDHRGTFRYDADARAVRLTGWSAQQSAAAQRAAHAATARIAAASPGWIPVPAPGPSLFTAHPLGGCAIGEVTDLEGRVRGLEGLYVVDGALLPGNAAGANPSLTIVALAERALAGIVRAGG
ncbi:GMC oxidoreductase [Streptomyces sp. N35]|uniref:GMC oxidoreductase n=1 Tax=Streptomyces sp. N35 TaxID=2795730 RepID=UPI0018F2CFA1|nr:GMC oxidoreductase [Streptomyces sp. N35]